MGPSTYILVKKILPLAQALPLALAVSERVGVKLLPLRSGSLRRKVVLNFVICLHIRDEELIKSLVSYFKSLNIQVSANAYLQQASPLVQAKRESEDITIVQA